MLTENAKKQQGKERITRREEKNIRNEKGRMKRRGEVGKKSILRENGKAIDVFVILQIK